MYDNKGYNKPAKQERGGTVVTVVPGEDKKATRVVIDDGTTFFDKKHGNYVVGTSYDFIYTTSEYEGKTYYWVDNYKTLDGTYPEQKEVKHTDSDRQELIIRQSSNKLVSDLLVESGSILEKKYRNNDYPTDARKIIEEQLNICDELLNYVINKAALVDEAVVNGRKFN
jgi:hypothetical protein